MTPKNNAEKGGQVPATLMTKPQAKISEKSSKKKSQKGNAPENVESESRKLKKCSTSVARESDQNPILDDEIDGLFDKLKAAKKQKISQGKGKGKGEGEGEGEVG